MRFVHPGVGTVNEEYLLAALSAHGKLLASGREVCYRRTFAPEDDRFIGDVFGLFFDEGRISLVGIEIKDWSAPVTPKVARCYLEVYGRSCDFVYLAARAFLPGVWRVARLGLIDLAVPRVIRRAERLAPDPRAWKFVTERLSKRPTVVPLHPNQKTLPAAGSAPEETVAKGGTQELTLAGRDPEDGPL